MVFIILYFLELFIRPQDWMSAFLGWPTHWLIIFPGIIYAAFSRLKNIKQVVIPHYWFLLAYLFLIFLSTTISVNMGYATQQTNLFFNRTIVFLFIVFLIDNEKKLRWTLFIYLLMSNLLAIHSFLQATGDVGWAGITRDPHYEIVRTRWVGIWDGSNTFGVIFACAIPIALEFFLHKDKPLVRFYGLISFIMAVPSLYYTNSRGDLLATLAGLGVYFFLRFKRKHAIIALVVSVVVFTIYSSTRMNDLSSQEESAHERVYSWEQGLEMFRTNPILGVGKGTFAFRNELGLIAHSNYVTVLSELGFTGFYIFIYFIYLSGVGLLRVYQQIVNESSLSAQNIPRGLVASLAVLLGATFFIVIEHDFFYLIMAMCTAGFMIYREKIGEAEKEYNFITLKDALLVFSGAIGIIILIYLVAVVRIM